MARDSKIIQIDGTPKQYSSAKQGTATKVYVTGRSDDLENQIRGKGQKFVIEGDGTEEMTINFGFIDDLYIKDGYLFWENAVFGDSLSLEIYLPANQPMPTKKKDGNYDLVAGNLVSNEAGTGDYMLFPDDVTLVRFVNEFMILGDNHRGFVIETNDTMLLPNILRLRGIVRSKNNNSAVRVVFAIEFYREQSI